ncbi:hypothetical protein AVEN_207193-1 [Araneus ventricosus]|uniref:Uncharacterized protein n=2 Tax=Araneus ventricosus TaxID=182803 RepID=A0A4Y2SI16_ARAVE|nr:hypothetical protein AVEN_243400-1 [Araneus ventricosus]GBN87415.1 hypothetical protein AVEN_207193-1 [Araneus ventricosus]
MRFLQAENWFVENNQYSRLLSNFTTAAKSHDDLWSCLHSAIVTQQLLEQHKWDVSDHPAYSPYLATSEFHLFSALKNWQGGQSFLKN